MTTLSERLKEVVRRTGLTPHALSLKAKLAGGHVGLMISGRAGKRPAAQTLTAIAGAAGVSAHWLETGEGSPDLPAGYRVVSDDRYPARARVLAALGGAYDPVAVRNVASLELHEGEGHDEAWWVRRLQVEHERITMDRAQPARVEQRAERSRVVIDKSLADEKARLAAMGERSEPEEPPPAGSAAAKRLAAPHAKPTTKGVK